MLTTTVDGLWVLQVLSGIEVMAPELGLRPHLPSVESAEMALAQPISHELRAAGVLTAGGTVDAAVLEWLTVLSRRDVALLVYLQTPEQIIEPTRMLMARFARWWVTVERNGLLVRIRGAGTATTEDAADCLISAQIERFCGALKPAALRPVTIDVAELVAAVKDPAGLCAFLLDHRFETEQINALTISADPERSARASVVAIQSGVSGDPARSHIDSGAVTIIDTPLGRLVSEQVVRAGKTWMIVGPGSATNIGTAMRNMLRRLPAQGDWYSHRKAV